MYVISNTLRDSGVLIPPRPMKFVYEIRRLVSRIFCAPVCKEAFIATRSPVPANLDARFRGEKPSGQMPGSDGLASSGE